MKEDLIGHLVNLRECVSDPLRGNPELLELTDKALTKILKEL